MANKDAIPGASSSAPPPQQPTPDQEENIFKTDEKPGTAGKVPYVSSERLYDSNEIDSYMNVLLYSAYGAGKTSLLASAAKHPAMGPMLILNYEGGLLSIKGAPGVKIRDVHTLDEVEDIFWKLIHKAPGYAEFKSIGIDSGTELQAMNLEGLARQAFQKKKKNRESPDDIFQEDYGKDTARLRRVFRWFRDAPFHFFVTALHKNVFKKDKRDKDAEPELVSVQPAFTNKLGESVAGFCNFVWYLYKDENEKRWILPQEKGVFRAKTRGHKFAAALGEKVSVDTSDPKGYDLAKLYDLLLKSEGLTPAASAPTTQALPKK